jgi:polygalacturonase
MMRIYNITDFGAVGDGITDNASDIQNTINTCSSNGGGLVLVPPGGTYMTGPFYLKSNVELHVSASSKLLANPDEMVYSQSAFKENYGEGSIWIGGKDAVNVTISGQGIIDGNGIAFMGPEDKAAYVLKEFHQFDRRPHLFTPINFRNLTIRDVTFKDSAYWCLHLVGCNDVTIHGIKIVNNLKIRNSDGIDPDHSKNVRISDCYIESGDDCICPKTRREYEEYGPTENITVTNCILKSTSCSIKLGSENMDAIRNVLFSNCIIRSSNRAIGIQNRDEGVVENIIFENIIIEGRLFDNVWWGKAEPIYVTAFKRQPGNARDANWRFAKGQFTGRVGEVKNILFSNIIAQSENGVYVGGEPGKVSDIRFRNVDLKIDKTTSYQGGQYDLRPSDTIGILEVETAGFYLDEAQEISIDNCRVSWGKNLQPYFGSAIFASRIHGLNISGFRGESAFPGLKKPMEIKNCEEVLVNNSKIKEE